MPGPKQACPVCKLDEAFSYSLHDEAGQVTLFLIFNQSDAPHLLKISPLRRCHRKPLHLKILQLLSPLSVERVLFDPWGRKALNAGVPQRLWSLAIGSNRKHNFMFPKNPLSRSHTQRKAGQQKALNLLFIQTDTLPDRAKLEFYCFRTLPSCPTQKEHQTMSWRMKDKCLSWRNSSISH